MILYSFFNSSTSYRVRIALALKGVEYQLRTVAIRKGEQYSAAHRSLSPIGGVPVLVTDDGEVLTQSLAILDYLDAIAPQVPLFPTEPMRRARVQELALLITWSTSWAWRLANDRSGTAIGSPRAWPPPKSCCNAPTQPRSASVTRRARRTAAWSPRSPMRCA